MTLSINRLIAQRTGQVQTGYVDATHYDWEPPPLESALVEDEYGVVIAAVLRGHAPRRAFRLDFPAVLVQQSYYRVWPTQFDPLLDELAAIHREVLPQWYEPYTNVTINRNRRVQAHADVVRPWTLAALVPIQTNKKYRLIFPEFRYAINPALGDLVFFNPSQCHGNMVKGPTLNLVAYTKETRSSQ